MEMMGLLILSLFFGTNLSANECEPKFTISFKEVLLHDKHFFRINISLDISI